MAKPAVNDIDRHIGLRLKKLRQQERLSAAALAEAIGSTQQQISRYENAQNKISASQLYLISRSLAVPIAWFFLDSEDTPAPLMIRESAAPAYSHISSGEEIATLQAMWPRISAAQRSAMLKLLDSFLE